MAQEGRPLLLHLRAWRLHRLLSQEALAKASGVGVATIIRLEKGGRANFLTVHRLAKGLDIKPQDLLGEPPA